MFEWFNEHGSEADIAGLGVETAADFTGSNDTSTNTAGSE